MNESLHQTVGRLQGDVASLKDGQDRVEATLAGQDVKLDQLLRLHHERKGAKRVTKFLVGLVTSGGFLGWMWEHFR